MSVKDIILIIVSYCSLKFADKFIEDNLPNLHYKKIIAAFNKHVTPVLLLGALSYYSVLSKISKDKEVQKTYMIVLTVIVAAIALQKIAQNKKPSALN